MKWKGWHVFILCTHTVNIIKRNQGKQGRMKEIVSSLSVAVIVSSLSVAVSTTLADVGRHKLTVIDGFDGMWHALTHISGKNRRRRGWSHMTMICSAMLLSSGLYLLIRYVVMLKRPVLESVLICVVYSSQSRLLNTPHSRTWST
jgi:hypothetical protein